MNADPRVAAPKSSLFYLVAITVFLITACLVPPWQGRFFNRDSPTSPWHDGGTFGLSRQFAPLFHPPQASSSSIPGKARYPWQPVSAHEQIQIDVVLFAAVIQIGLAAIGIIARLPAALESPGRPGPIITFAFALAISQLISVILIVCYAAATLFSGSDQAIWIFPLVCGTIGCVVGLWKATRSHAGK